MLIHSGVAKGRSRGDRSEIRTSSRQWTNAIRKSRCPVKPKWIKSRFASQSFHGDFRTLSAIFGNATLIPVLRGRRERLEDRRTAKWSLDPLGNRPIAERDLLNRVPRHVPQE